MNIRKFLYRVSLFYFSTLVLILTIDTIAFLYSSIFPHNDLDISEFLKSLTYFEFWLFIPGIIFFLIGKVNYAQNETPGIVEQTDPPTKKVNGWSIVSRVLGVLIIIVTLSMVLMFYLGGALIISFFMAPVLILFLGLFFFAAAQ